MTIDIRVEEFNPVEIIESGKGVLIVAKTGDATDNIGVYAAIKNVCEYPHDLAALYKIKADDVLGGALITVQTNFGLHEIHIGGSSTAFGGIPQEVCDAMQKSLETHVAEFDYKGYQQPKYEAVYNAQRDDAMKKQFERKEQVIKMRKAYTKKCAQVDSELNKKIKSWRNRWAAKLRRQDVAEYVREKYKDMIPEEPKFPERIHLPVYRFKPMQAKKIVLTTEEVLDPSGRHKEKWNAYLKEVA